MTETVDLNPEAPSLGVYMNETDPEVITEQIRVGLEKEKNDPSMVTFLNNFFMNMPGGINRQLYASLGEAILVDPENSETMPNGELRFSPRARTVTVAEFFEDINRTSAGRDLIETYREMRQLGYSHEDLVR